MGAVPQRIVVQRFEKCAVRHFGCKPQGARVRSHRDCFDGARCAWAGAGLMLGGRGDDSGAFGADNQGVVGEAPQDEQAPDEGFAPVLKQHRDEHAGGASQIEQRRPGVAPSAIRSGQFRMRCTQA